MGMTLFYLATFFHFFFVCFFIFKFHLNSNRPISISMVIMFRNSFLLLKVLTQLQWVLEILWTHSNAQRSFWYSKGAFYLQCTRIQLIALYKNKNQSWYNVWLWTFAVSSQVVAINSANQASIVCKVFVNINKIIIIKSNKIIFIWCSDYKWCFFWREK